MGKTASLLAKLWNDESGMTSIEYGLLLAFVAAGIILGAETLSGAVVNEMEGAASCMATGDTAKC